MQTITTKRRGCSPGGQATGVRAIVLLEVVLSLVMFAACVTVVSSAVSRCQWATERIRIRSVLSDLAYSRLSELHVGIIDPVEVSESEFEDPLLEDYRWSLQIISEDDITRSITGCDQVIVNVRHVPTNLTYRMAEQLGKTNWQAGINP